MIQSHRKYFKIGPYGLAALLAIALATLLRVILISFDWPITNSDEGTMGLMALHIAFRGEQPIFFYGQNYMGALEAYIAAVLFRVFGPSLFTLRLGLVLLFACFLLIMYLLTRLLYTKKLALFTSILLCFGSEELFTRQLKAVGGAIETLLFGSLILLLAFWLALSFQPAATLQRRRFVLYGALGLTMGLGIWSHMLVLPFVAVGILALLLFCHKELRTWPGLLLLSALFIGLLPLLIYNLENPQQNTIRTLLFNQSSGGTMVSLKLPFVDRILGTILISLPTATGANSLYPVSSTPGQWLSQVPHLLPQAFWGVGYLLLWTIAVLLTVKALAHAYQHYKKSPNFAEKQAIVRASARLLLLAAAGLTLLAYVLSPAPALVPATSSRYLVGLLITTPALISPLWDGTRVWSRAAMPSTFAAITRILRYGVLLFIGIVFFSGTVGVFQQVPRVYSITQSQYTLVDDLERLHMTRIYADYWTCDRVIFLSNERIICSVLADNLRPGQDRYPPYRAIVRNDPRAVYLFPVGSPPAINFARETANSAQLYHRSLFDGYILFQPVVLKAPG